jgi:thiol:disulfide interchange protein
MLADWSTENPIIEEFLDTFEHPSIPYYLVIPPKGPVQALDAVITPGQLLEAFTKATAGRG